MDAWLELHANGYEELTLQERCVIKDFSLVWSYFEAQVLNTHFSVAAAIKKIESWRGKEILLQKDFDEIQRYFIARYIENGETNHKFENLEFNLRDNRALVERVLLGNSNDLCEIISALLIIVYRYRNNLFHGTKWAYSLHSQYGNFSHACDLLIRLLEINDSINQTLV